MKIFNNTMLIATLFVMSTVNAKQVGGTKSQSRVISEQKQIDTLAREQAREEQQINQLKQELQKYQQSQSQIASAPLSKKQSKNITFEMAMPVSSSEWTKIVRELTLGSPSTNRINQIKQMDLTDEQMAMLSIIEQNILLKKQLIVQEVTKEKPKTKQPLRRWFSKTFSGEAGNIATYKNMIMAKLDDVEKYPTLKSKKDALDLGLEFFSAEYNDENIMKKALKGLKTEFSQERDSLKQERINVLNDKMRKHFNVDLATLGGLSIEEKIDYLKNYLKRNKAGIKDFVKEKITNENVTALLHAIISETARINMMIKSLESIKSPRAVVAPQERRSGVSVNKE